MDEKFHQSPQISKESLKILMQRSDAPALSRFAITFLLLIATSIWTTMSWGGYWWVFSQVVFGSLCCSMFAALHETAHGTAFRSKKMNQWAARLAGIAHLYPSGIFRELHFTHHRHTHIPGLDPEISLGNRPAPVIITNLPLYLSWLTGLPILLFKIIMLLNGALGMPEPIRMNLYPFIKPEKRYKIMLDSWLVLAVHGVFLYLALFVNTGFWALFTGQVVGHCFLAFYVSMEHNGLPHEGNIFDKTRSIRAYVWVKWLMWNMPYHAEHHAYPAVPFHALPALHKQLQEELKHQGETHVKFHLKTLGNLVKVK